MRPAVGICALALLLAGCGAGATPHAASPSSKVQVMLNLKGGAPVALADCGPQHHFTRYAARARIEFAGTVKPVPPGHWKVKLKIKRCRAGGSADVAKVAATRDKRSGAFNGTLPNLPGGSYFARASLYVDGRKTARSDKQHFSLR